MRFISIIKPDNAVGIDGQFLSVDCSGLPESFIALQFDLAQGYGEIEWSGNPKPPNMEMSQLGTFQRFVDAWQAEKERRDNEPPEEPDPIYSVTAAQAKVALYDYALIDGELVLRPHGGTEPSLLDKAEAVVEAYGDRRIRLWFDCARDWERENTYVLGIGLELGLTEAQMDVLFAYASTLEK